MASKNNLKTFQLTNGLTEKDKEDYKKADKWHIRDKKYVEKDITVRGHCYITGNYRESVYQDCNIN